MEKKTFKKDDVVQIRIEDIADTGNGIGKCEGLAIFVKNALPGDLVLAKLTKVKKNYALATATQILEPSPFRVEKHCKYIECGGCQFDGFAYEGQLAIKEKMVRDRLTRIAGIEEPNLAHIIGMSGEDSVGHKLGVSECKISNECTIEKSSPKNRFYRNKAQMPISFVNGKPSVGFFRAKSHDVVDCLECTLQMPPASAVAGAVRVFLNETKVSCYDRSTGKGLLRHVVVKTAAGTGEVMVILVATRKEIPHIERLAELIDDAIYNIEPEKNGIEYSLESLVINVNKGTDSRVLGEECIVIAGKSTILEKVGEMSFEISPLAFYQVNPIQMEKLYAKVLEYCDLKGTEKIFDLYCGIGTIGLFCAKEMLRKYEEQNGEVDYARLGEVYGIESVKGAVLSANRNAVINGIAKARYITGRAEEEIQRLTRGYEEKDGTWVEGISPDIVILDPPRAGCERELLDEIIKVAPKKIIYVSCDPATMARDIKILMDGECVLDGTEREAAIDRTKSQAKESSKVRYELCEATPVDMFPWCTDVETVVSLVRKSLTHMST